MAVLVGLAVALLVGVLLAGRIVRRITALRRTALHVAELGPVAEVMTAGAGTDEVGDLTRAFATMQDRLREQEEVRRAFVATASHELRTPLAALRLTLDLAAAQLEDAGAPAQAGAAQVQRAQGQADRLSRLADELLELSRLDAGVPMRRELVELGELARAVTAELTPAAAARDVEIALLADGPTWVEADPGAVARIARILVDNALRFSPAGGRIALSTGVDGDVANLTRARRRARRPRRRAPADLRALPARACQHRERGRLRARTGHRPPARRADGRRSAGRRRGLRSVLRAVARRHRGSVMPR